MGRAEERSLKLWVVLWRATRAVEERVAAHIAALGLCGSDFGVLEALLHRGPLTVGALGGKVLLSSGSMTAAVDRLEARGLAERRPSPADRRAREIRLTAAGRRLIAGAMDDHAAAVRRALGGLSAAEQDQAIGLLKRIGFHARDLPA